VRQSKQSLTQFALTSVSFLYSNPVLFQGRRVSIVYFGIFAGLNAFFTASTIFLFAMAKGVVFQHSMYLIIGLGFLLEVFFARVFHILALGTKFFANPKKYLRETAFYNQGGILGSAIWLILVAHLEDTSVFLLFDAGAYGAAIGLFFGRLGCLNYGCCYGRITSDGPGIEYKHRLAKVLRQKPKYAGKPLIPTQLYSALFNLSLFGLLTLLLRLPLPDGAISLVFLVLFNAWRLFIERFRDDINYDEGRNIFTAVVAKLYLGAGVLLSSAMVAKPVWFSWRDYSFLPDAAHYLDEVILNPDLIIPTLLLSLGIAAVYGIQGRQLGQHW